MASPIRKILITAGPTRESIDPVRFLSNLSTGEMGYAIARAAIRKKYQVTLVSGPVALKPPSKARFFPVTTTAEMKAKCVQLFPKQDCLIMAAAVSDFMPVVSSRDKIPSGKGLTLKLRRTPDILQMLAARKGKRKVIGFCLETKELLQRAKVKLIQKNLDGIVANYYDSKRHIPFGNHLVEVVLINSEMKICRCPKLSKDQIANQLLAWVEKL